MQESIWSHSGSSISGGGDCAIDVIDKPELLEGGFKEGVPLPKVAVVDVDGDGSMAVDVEQHNFGSWRWDWIGHGERTGVHGQGGTSGGHTPVKDQDVAVSYTTD